MVEVQFPVAAAQLKAEEVIKRKPLWVAPTWNCNRLNAPCRICFASTVMRDARDRDYQYPSGDFFAKLQVLSALPFKEVILSGGEPANDSELLEVTLASINPRRSVRIITNGDWVLNEQSREEILSAIRESNRSVRVDVSAHDSESGLERKLRALQGRVDIGVQVRLDEGRSRDIVRREGIPTEVHKILEIGEAAKFRETNNPHLRRKIELEKLVGYYGRKNAGIFLALCPEGTKVVANHETPYLIGETPADIANGEDSAEEALRNVVNYYATLEFARDPTPNYMNAVLDETAVAFAIAAFRSGVPLDFHNYGFVGRLPEFQLQTPERFTDNVRELMNGYYRIISGWSGELAEDLKVFVARVIAKKIFDSMSKNKIPRQYDFYSSPAVFAVGETVPRDSVQLRWAIINGTPMGGIFLRGFDERPFHGLEDFLSDINFLRQISSLGISIAELSRQLTGVAYKND